MTYTERSATAAGKPVSPQTKKPFYSNVPALLGADDMGDSCRPLYTDLIHQYLSNSQRLLFTQRQHPPLLNSYEGDLFMGQFLYHPYQKISSGKKRHFSLLSPAKFATKNQIVRS